MQPLAAQNETGSVPNTVLVEAAQALGALPVRVALAQLDLVHRLDANAMVRRSTAYKACTTSLVGTTAELAPRYVAAHTSAIHTA